jgi:hypothetical protein
MGLENVIRKVEQDRRRRANGMWGSFCTVSAYDDDDDDDKNFAQDDKFERGDAAKVRALKSEEICSILNSRGRVHSSMAPFLGPARKFGKFCQINIHTCMYNIPLVK